MPRGVMRALSPGVAGLLALAIWCGPPLARGADSPTLQPAPRTGTAEDARAAFERGLRLFEEARTYASNHLTDREEVSRRYREAGESFTLAWKAGAASTEVFTNAANSFSFAGDTGKAVLFYRRALAVDPANKRAQTALEHTRADLPIRKPEGGAGQSILTSLFFWHGTAFSLRRLAFQILFPAAFVCFALALRKRRPFRSIGLFLLACSVALLGSILTDAVGGSIHNEAVVITQVQGRLGDGTTYSASHQHPFPPGTEVTVRQVRHRKGKSPVTPEPWLLVRLLNGQESWIPQGVVEFVVPAAD